VEGGIYIGSVFLWKKETNENPNSEQRGGKGKGPRKRESQGDRSATGKSLRRLGPLSFNKEQFRPSWRKRGVEGGKFLFLWIKQIREKKGFALPNC